MTDAPKKRPWFQFSLATAIVMMFVAGGLIGANFTPRPGAVTQADFPGAIRMGYGWPFVADIRVRYDGHDQRVKVSPDEREIAFNPPDESTGTWILGNSRLNRWRATANVMCGLGILVVVAILCEWRIRRKERRP